jgi:hypothetical protein
VRNPVSLPLEMSRDMSSGKLDSYYLQLITAGSFVGSGDHLVTPMSTTKSEVGLEVDILTTRSLQCAEYPA